MGVARVHVRCHPLFARQCARMPAYIGIYTNVRANTQRAHSAAAQQCHRAFGQTYRKANKTWGGTQVAGFMPPRASLPPPSDMHDCPEKFAPVRARYWRHHMQEMTNVGQKRDASRSLLSGWISRADLAQELEVTEATLRRWASERWGPPCIRAGRKIFYRRSAVVEWLEDQEAVGLRRARRSARR